MNYTTREVNRAAAPDATPFRRHLPVLLLLMAAATGAYAQVPAERELRHTVSSCPLGVAFGIFSANYEYLIAPHHGVVARMDYEAIPGTYSKASIEANGMAVVINYRWHIQGEMESWFLGAYSRYRQYQGQGEVDTTEFDFTLRDLTVGLNAGKRWIWENGFAITAAFGYGHSFAMGEENRASGEIDDAVDAFEKDYDFASPFLGELSVGYAF